MKLSPRIALSLAAGLVLAGCYEVPVTGRKALNLVNESEMAKISAVGFAEIKAKTRLSRNETHIALVERIGERLRGVVPIWDMPDADWEFLVFDAKDVNAFAMAGGKGGVYEGLFKIIDNEDQLAFVMAHELAHVTAKHVHERVSHALAMQSVGLLGTAALMVNGVGALSQEALMSAYGFGAAAGGLAFDRRMEREADYIGLMYMAQAGYDPNESIKVLDRLNTLHEAAGMGSGSWLSTHPSHPERIIALLDAMPKALKTRDEARAQKASPVIIKGTLNNCYFGKRAPARRRKTLCRRVRRHNARNGKFF
ncbi:MAG: repeat-containing protein YfgC precursor, partial [Verrucomicrobiota bacterium]